MNEIIFKALLGWLNLVVFRTSPVVLPFSNILLATLIVLEMTLNTLALQKLDGISIMEVVASTIAYITIYLGLVYAASRAFEKQERFHKIVLALLGTELLLIAFLQLLSAVIPATAFASLQIIFIIWIFFIKSRILKLGFEISWLKAIVITMGITIISSIPTTIVIAPYLNLD